MTDNLLKLFCVVESESTPFPVKIKCTETISDLKKAIKDEKTPRFDDDNDDDNDDDDLPILLNNIPNDNKKKLKAVTNKVSDVFGNEPDEKMIHVIVQRPQPVPRQLQS
ncbi:hypothetical protein BGZ82_008641 [Podila clonocystis]|nr:hypothetical protein BGZ82_008641 [Podila clonocystis]